MWSMSFIQVVCSMSVDLWFKMGEGTPIPLNTGTEF